MARRTPLHGGFVVALLWIVTQIALWAAVAIATAFLSLVLVFLLAGTLNPNNWSTP